MIRPPFFDKYGIDSNQALGEKVRQVMQEIAAAVPGARVADAPSLFAFGPIYRALAEAYSSVAPDASDQERGRAFCAHCEWFEDYDMGSSGQERARVAMLAHAKTCAFNPLVAEIASLREQLEAMRLERETALDVLRPAMRSSGLVDACKQVKQAHISERDNCEQAGSQLTAIRLTMQAAGLESSCNPKIDPQ